MVQRLTSIINFWGERKVFDPETIAALTRSATLPAAAPALATSAPSAAAALQVLLPAASLLSSHLMLQLPVINFFQVFTGEKWVERILGDDQSSKGMRRSTAAGGIH